LKYFGDERLVAIAPMDVHFVSWFMDRRIGSALENPREQIV
jgi:hypothetical protein